MQTYGLVWFCMPFVWLGYGVEYGLGMLDYALGMIGVCFTMLYYALNNIPHKIKITDEKKPQLIRPGLFFIAYSLELQIIICDNFASQDNFGCV